MRKIILFTVCLLFFCTNSIFAEENENLVSESGFENSNENNIWETQTWDQTVNASSFSIDNSVAYTGNNSAFISNNIVNDSRYSQVIKVHKNSYYHLSCWIKTENVGEEQKGANLSINGILDTSQDIKGTSNDWKYVELYGITGQNQTELTLTLGIGGYSSTNTGKAWFDDVSVSEVVLDDIPVGVNVVKLYNNQPSQENNNSISFMLIYTLIFLIIVLSCYYITKRSNKELYFEQKSILFGTLIFATIFKLILAPKIIGYPSDISCFISWASSAANDLANFYNSGIFCDYPPLYIIILSYIGKIANALHFAYNSSGYLILLKFPSILAESVTAYLLYKVSKNIVSEKLRLLIAISYVFNPAVLLNSTLWGQVDSFFTLIIVIALLFIMKKQIKSATVAFVLAVLMKPQGIIFLPILFFELLKRKNLKYFIQALAVGILTVIVIILPFTINKSPLWIFDLYINTANGYKYASMNAFNFFALFGGNMINDSAGFFLLSYKTWGFIFIAFVTLYIGFLFYKAKKAYVSVFSAMIIISGVFIMSSRMHERYMLPVIALSLLSYVYIKDKRILFLYIGFSFTNFLNTYDVLSRMLTQNMSFIPSDSLLLVIVSIANVMLFIYMIIISLDIIIRNKIKNDEQDVRLRQNNIIQTKSNKPLVKKNYDYLPSKQDTRMNKIDIILMLSITAVYLILTLINLGDRYSPETYWTSKTVDSSFVIDFDKPIQISRITYYCALGDGWNPEGEYMLSYFDGSDYKEFADIKKDTVFCWEYLDTNIQTNKVKLTVISPGGGLGELGFFTNKNEQVKTIKISEKSSQIGDAEKLFDEQNRVVYKPSYLNGTYFDEIYFARTAYEYLNGLVAYETTHPPFGKILIALGVKLFGMNPFGWRIIGALFGVIMLPIMYLFGKKFFGKTFFAFSLAFLLMFDFMHFTQTRIATIDGFITTFIILMYYFMYDYFIYQSSEEDYKKSLKALGLCGLFFGLGIATKWIGLYSGAGLAFLFFLALVLKRSKIQWKLILWCFVFFIGIPLVIYSLAYIPIINTVNDNNWLKVIMDNQRAMLSYHNGLMATHPFSSPWWQWPFIIKPTWYYLGQAVEIGKTSTIAAMGNPAIWWVGIVTTLLSAILAYRKKDKRMVVIFTAIFFQYVPWIFVSRITFIYHYFSITPFLMVAIVYIIQYILDKYPNKKIIIYGYFVLIVALFVAFYPVLSGLEVSEHYIESLKWFKSWIF